jgi:hypothetical protein
MIAVTKQAKQFGPSAYILFRAVNSTSYKFNVSSTSARNVVSIETRATATATQSGPYSALLRRPIDRPTRPTWSILLQQQQSTHPVSTLISKSILSIVHPRCLRPFLASVRPLSHRCIFQFRYTPAHDVVNGLAPVTTGT